MKKVDITCDNCDNDLSKGVNKFRLSLKAEVLPHSGGPIPAVIVYPPIKEEKHFCDMRCLKRWLSRDE